MIAKQSGNSAPGSSGSPLATGGREGLLKFCKLRFRAPVRKVGERVKLRLDVLRRNGCGEGSCDDGEDVVFEGRDFHHASPSTRVGARRSRRHCNPASAPAMMIPPGEISSAFAKTGSKTGRQHLKCLAASSRLMRGDV